MSSHGIENKRLLKEALFSAASSGNMNILEYLISSLHLDLDSRDSTARQRTPLMDASYYGRLESIKYLIDKGADIKARDSESKTALYHAIRSDEIAVVEFLLSKGTELDENDDEEGDVIVHAVQFQSLDVLKYFVEELKLGASLHPGLPSVALRSANLEILQYLISELGMTFESFQGSLLRVACHEHFLEMFQFLVEEGEDPNQDVYGKPLIVYCIENGRLDLVRYLLDIGVTLDLDQASICASVSVQHGDIELAEYLLQLYPTMSTEILELI